MLWKIQLDMITYFYWVWKNWHGMFVCVIVYSAAVCKRRDKISCFWILLSFLLHFPKLKWGAQWLMHPKQIFEQCVSAIASDSIKTIVDNSNKKIKLYGIHFIFKQHSVHLEANRDDIHNSMRFFGWKGGREVRMVADTSFVFIFFWFHFIDDDVVHANENEISNVI